MTTVRAMPVIQVSDVPNSIQFYRRLGFASHGEWVGDDGSGDVFFSIVQRGDVTIGLQLLRGPLRVNTHWAAYIYVSNAEALHTEFEAEGLEPTRLEARPYGCRDFDIADPDGHLIAFGEDMDPEPHGPGLGPERGVG